MKPGNPSSCCCKAAEVMVPIPSGHVLVSWQMRGDQHLRPSFCLRGALFCVTIAKDGFLTGGRL
ncbi:hypothetical protein EDD73_13623 [Heliophilum fasciatum]|uniref:Uncharacterized protein n=1 Tax=Heliophilum fasciatum TaxID=35700 RepID=A0A4R2RDC7_9FIRM|nr:hypothetical protein EDD73_13623 [Heliophilum fasciatum]